MSATTTAGISERHFALVGTPNSGKTALFNALTGSRQKVANYPGPFAELPTTRKLANPVKYKAIFHR